MTAFKLRAWTGPAAVREIGEKLREAGVEVLIEGTEHIIVSAEGSDAGAAGWNVLVDLRREHGTDFGLRFSHN